MDSGSQVPLRKYAHPARSATDLEINPKQHLFKSTSNNQSIKGKEAESKQLTTGKKDEDK